MFETLLQVVQNLSVAGEEKISKGESAFMKSFADLFNSIVDKCKNNASHLSVGESSAAAQVLFKSQHRVFGMSLDGTFFFFCASLCVMILHAFSKLNFLLQALLCRNRPRGNKILVGV